MSDRPPSERIAACLVCRDEADRIGPALESVNWCDEIVVMDLESGDDSAAVATRAGARVVSRPPVPIVELVRNEAAAAAESDWILVLDPDERVSPGLAAELEGVRSDEGVDAVVVPRMNIDFGSAPTSRLHRYEPQLRMYRRSRVSWPTFPNALPQVSEERLHRVEARDDLVLVHDRNRNVHEAVERLLRYAPAQGQAMATEGRVFSAAQMFDAIGRKAYRELVMGEPWRDGIPGLLRASLLVSFHLYVWTAFWQASGSPRSAADDRAVRRLGLVLRVAGLGGRVAGAAARGSRSLRRARGGR